MTGSKASPRGEGIGGIATAAGQSSRTHALKDFGERVQYSVFECRLTTDQVEHLSARVAKLVDPAEDSVRIYRLCAGCADRVEIQGLGKVTEEDPKIVFL